MKCPFYEEKNRIMKAVESADVLIFTTPTYCMRASAPMKSFIDLTFNYWMVHRPRKCMFSKQAIVVTCGISVQAMNWAGVADKKKQAIEKDTKKIAIKY